MSTSSLPISPATRRALTLTLMVTLLAVIPQVGFAADIGDIFGDLESATGRTKLFITGLISIFYLGIIGFCGWKLMGDEEKKWKVAVGGISGIAILAGMHAYALSKVGSG